MCFSGQTQSVILETFDPCRKNLELQGVSIVQHRTDDDSRWRIQLGSHWWKGRCWQGSGSAHRLVSIEEFSPCSSGQTLPPLTHSPFLLWKDLLAYQPARLPMAEFQGRAEEDLSRDETGSNKWSENGKRHFKSTLVYREKRKRQQSKSIK